MVDAAPRIEADAPVGIELPNYLDLLRIVRHRKWLLILGIVAGIVLGCLYYAQCVPIFQSDAQVLVIKKRPEAVTGASMSPSHFEDYVSTHRILIQSPLIVERAIQRSDLGSLQCLAGRTERRADAIISGLSIGRVSGASSSTPNSVLKLAFQSSVPTECGTVVNAILESYKSFLDETYRSMSDDTVALITAARNELENNLSKKETEYREFREKSPMIWKGQEEVNPRLDRLTQIESKRSALLLRRTELESQLTTIERARDAGGSQEKLVFLVSELASKRESSGSDQASSSTLQSQLLPLLLEEQTLLQDYGANNPLVLSVRQRIESTRKFFALPSAAYFTTAEGANQRDQLLAVNVVQLHIDSLKQELDSINAAEQLLTKLYDKEHEVAREMNSYEIKDADFRSTIARSQLLYDGLVKRLHDVDMVKDYGGFDARIISPAGDGKKIFPRKTTIFATFGLLGIAAGLGLVYLAEVSDQRFRTPEEIRRRLGVTVIGHIPLIHQDQQQLARFTDDSGLDQMLIAHYRPRAPDTEAYRAVRTALYFSSAGEGHKVIQITSPGMGDGKSTLASNLAVLIAQSGKSTLLIDADLRRPRQHKIFGVSGEDGLSTVIAQRAELADAIQTTAVPHLSLLPCGPLPPDPAELLVSPRFPQLLDVLRDKYEYVIVDTPPLLAVTDPCVVAARVDALILTIRIAKNGRHQAKRAKDILATLGVKVLGVVVNGLSAQKDAGYYGDYYANSYGYDQEYTDSSGDDLKHGEYGSNGRANGNANGHRVRISAPGPRDAAMDSHS